MAIARHYGMEAAEGQMDGLLEALNDLAASVEQIAGCEGVDILQDMAAPARIIFIERWASVDAHKASASLIPPELMGRVMAALSGRPAAAYLEYRTR